MHAHELVLSSQADSEVIECSSMLAGMIPGSSGQFPELSKALMNFVLPQPSQLLENCSLYN